VPEQDAIAFLDPLSRSRKRFPPLRTDAHVKRGGHGKLASPFPHALTLKLSRDHARIVEDEGIAGPQHLGQIAYVKIIQINRRVRPHDKQPCAVARTGGP
jgi:hypothetical protein